MNAVNKLHDKSMEFAQKAFMAQKQGDIKKFIELSIQAYHLEKRAAMLLIDNIHSLDRTVLFKSSAFLAFDAKKYMDAKELLTEAKKGLTIPENIRIELFKLERDINFELNSLEFEANKKNTIQP